MKKIAVIFLMLMLPLTLFGCGSTEEKTETIDPNSPKGLTQEYIRAVTNYEHAKAAGYLSAEYSNNFVTLSNTINELKTYDVFTEDNINNGPDVIKANDSKAITWYAYETGKYVKFDLIKENNLWKINMISFWSNDNNGDPEKVSLD